MDIRLWAQVTRLRGLLAITFVWSLVLFQSKET